MRRAVVMGMWLLASCQRDATPPAGQGATPAQASRDPELESIQIAEAKAVLQAIYSESVSLFTTAEGDAPSFPPSVPLTPAQACCSQPGKVCGTTGWDAPTWKTLSIKPDRPTHYRYEYQSSGSGKTATFTARAVGDPKCTGAEEVWEISARAGEDGAVTDIGKARARRVK